MVELRECFIVRRSSAGRGLFARAPFQKGDYVVEYTGLRIPTEIADTLETRYLFDLENGWTVDGSPQTNRARYMNHSCTPNCEARIKGGKIRMHALRDIAIGEELTFDYGDEYFDEFIRPSGCACAHCMSNGAVHAAHLVAGR